MVLHHMTVFTEAIILDMEQSVLDPPMPLHQESARLGSMADRLVTAYCSLSTHSPRLRCLTLLLTLITLDRPGNVLYPASSDDTHTARCCQSAVSLGCQPQVGLSRLGEGELRVL